MKSDQVACQACTAQLRHSEGHPAIQHNSGALHSISIPLHNHMPNQTRQAKGQVWWSNNQKYRWKNAMVVEEWMHVSCQCLTYLVFTNDKLDDVIEQPHICKWGGLQLTGDNVFQSCLAVAVWTCIDQYGVGMTIRKPFLTHPNVNHLAHGKVHGDAARYQLPCSVCGTDQGDAWKRSEHCKLIQGVIPYLVMCMHSVTLPLNVSLDVGFGARKT